MKTSRKSYTLEEAKKKIEYYCSYRERCHKEVREKLVEMRMIPEAVDTLMAHLIECDFLNEERFARAFAGGKFRQKKWGKKRVVRELKHREISSFNINRALEEMEKDYLITLHELAIKRLKELHDHNLQRRKRKLADYLLYRGWESHLVYDKVHELIP